MTHRTVNVAERTVEVFNTTMAAMRWAKRHKQDCIIVARNKFYFQRKDGFEMTIRLDATDCPENRHLVAAANQFADEVEKHL
jgi:hypothetical protein